MKTFLTSFLVAFTLALSLALAFGVNQTAAADRTYTSEISSTESDITYIEIKKTGPNSWLGKVCGIPRLVGDGGIANLPEGPCDECNLGTRAQIPTNLATCISNWKTNRSL